MAILTATPDKTTELLSPETIEFYRDAMTALDEAELNETKKVLWFCRGGVA